MGLFFTDLSKSHDENKMLHDEFLPYTHPFYYANEAFALNLWRWLFVQNEQKTFIEQKTFKLHSEFKPTLVIAHNKTLAGQLYGEFKEFFHENAVEYFVS